jgi:hypothetical protein
MISLSTRAKFIDACIDRLDDPCLRTMSAVAKRRAAAQAELSPEDYESAVKEAHAAATNGTRL